MEAVVNEAEWATLAGAMRCRTTTWSSRRDRIRARELHELLLVPLNLQSNLLRFHIFNEGEMRAFQDHAASLLLGHIDSLIPHTFQVNLQLVCIIQKLSVSETYATLDFDIDDV